jgi:hypothetical protein
VSFLATADLQWRFAASVLVALLCAPLPAHASNHYTQKQLNVLAERIGKIYWVDSDAAGTLVFLSAPDSGAPSFKPGPFESFEIVELVGQKSRNPFYKVKTESGKTGFIRPDHFLEQLNLTIVAIDPRADEKQRAAVTEEEEQKRIAWIQKQPWSQAVKDAAVKRRAVPGMTAAETKRVRGDPTRIFRVRGPQRSSEEHWFYPDGDVLVFQNGLLYQLRKNEKEQQPER